jgi:hypothetical protein
MVISGWRHALSPNMGPTREVLKGGDVVLGERQAGKSLETSV